MKREESRYPQDWFRIGDKEFKRAENLLNLGDMNGAGFNVHQAIEKYLKAYLLFEGWDMDLWPENCQSRPWFYPNNNTCSIARPS